MAGILDLMARIQSIDLSAIGAQAIEAAKDTYAQQQRDQMFDGKASDGRQIAKSYSTVYGLWKKRRYPNLPRHVSLHLTGYFQSRISLDVKGGKIIYFSEDRQKDGWLTGQYGERIWGLFGKYKRPFVSRVQSEYVDLLKQELGV